MCILRNIVYNNKIIHKILFTKIYTCRYRLSYYVARDAITTYGRTSTYRKFTELMNMTTALSIFKGIIVI